MSGEYADPSLDSLDRDAELAADFIEGVLDILDLPGEIEVGTPDDPAWVTVHDVGSGVLIGRRGSTLDALQEVTRGCVQRQTQQRTYVRVDVEGYRQRQLEELREQCRDAIVAVREEAEAVALDPMPPFERKLMHDLVAGSSGVHSVSEGVDDRRHVVIHPGDE